jgi:hypothetical protein
VSAEPTTSNSGHAALFISTYDRRSTWVSSITVRLRSRFYRSAHRLLPRAARRFTATLTYLPTYLLLDDIDFWPSPQCHASCHLLPPLWCSCTAQATERHFLLRKFLLNPNVIKKFNMLQRIQCLLPQLKNYRFVQAIPRFRLPAVREARPPTFGASPSLVLPTRCTQPILDSNNLRDSMDLQFLERLGRCLVSDGRYNDAERPYTQVMEMRKRVLREEHPYTLRSVSSRALGFAVSGASTRGK